MRALKSSQLDTRVSPSNLRVSVWLSHQVNACPSNFGHVNEIFFPSSIWWTLKQTSNCFNQWFSFIRLTSSWYNLISIFASILNKECDWFMALKLGWYFLGSFFGWLFVSSRYFFPSVDLSSTFETPSSQNIPSLFFRPSMRTFTLWFISTTCFLSRGNLISARSWGSFTYSLAMIRVLRFSAPPI